MGVMVQGAGGQSLPWAWGAGGQPAGSVSAPRPIPKGLSCTPALSQPGTLWGRSPLPPHHRARHTETIGPWGGPCPPCPAPALTSPRRLQAARPPRPCPPGPAHVRMEPGARPLLALCLASCLLAPGKRQRGRRGALTPTQPWAWGEGPWALRAAASPRIGHPWVGDRVGGLGLVARRGGGPGMLLHLARLPVAPHSRVLGVPWEGFGCIRCCSPSSPGLGPLRLPGGAGQVRLQAAPRPLRQLFQCPAPRGGHGPGAQRHPPDHPLPDY